jgi:ribonuclease R
MKTEFNTLKARIQSLLAASNYQPLRANEIIAALKVPPNDRGLARRTLDHLLQKGVIVRIRKDRFVLPSEADLVTGRIQMHERGFGFVTPESSAAGSRTEDIFIPAEDTWVAMHGDSVVVRIHAGDSGRRSGVPQQKQATYKRFGRVIRILERANTRITGVLHRSQHFYHVMPDDPRIGRDIYINYGVSALKPKVNDRVVVKLLPWENRHVNPEGLIDEIIGPSDDPSLDILVIVKKFGFRVDFPKEALAQADAIPERISDSERERRTDFRDELVITIDPDDARDYDDALSLKKLPNGNWSLGVHIADVSHYVRPGTPLDKEAKERGNSVYLPDRVIPMLPPQLSNEMCSLKEKVERLTQSVIFDVTPDGEVQSYVFRDTVIRSAARLTYHKALSVLDPKPGRPPEVKDAGVCALLKNLWHLASKLRYRRFTAGSLDLDFPELKVYCNAEGLAERIEKQENDISHQLVEEFMLLANEAVAAETLQRTVPSIYRIHEDPDPERLDQYRELVLANGLSIGDPTVRGEIQRFLKKLAGKPEEYILKLHLLRSLKRAQYSIHPVGHFGLAKENYTHFTSPIRRYADLIIHRSLIRATRKMRKLAPDYGKSEPAYDVATLEAIAGHCSSTERVADEAEKEAVKLKLMEYFERQLKERQLNEFEALITEVRNFGVFVELPQFMLSGLVHVSTLDDDFYQFDPVRQKLIGKRTRRTLQAGEKVKVQVERVDRYKKQIDFRFAE